MSINKETLEQLDLYILGTLSADERRIVEERMQDDESFRDEVQKHRQTVDALRQMRGRAEMRALLETFDDDVNVPDGEGLGVSKNTDISFVRRYFPTFAVAASVALISVVGTLITMQSFHKKQTAEYRELRKNVDQIRKSQRSILAGIRAVNGKENVVSDAYEGTGFLISSDGYAATSYHVVREADSIYLENEKFGRIKAMLVYSDAASDIAILKIVDKKFQFQIPFAIAKTDASIGEDVYTLGFPKDDIVFGEGSVSSSTGFKGDMQMYQIAVPVNPGNSGGPLINDRGELVGIISGTQTETSGTAFAVKSFALTELIENSNQDSLKITLSKVNRLKKLSKVDQVKKMKDVVFMVRVYNTK